MTEAIKKLIAENRWRDIKDAPRDGEDYFMLLSDEGLREGFWMIFPEGAEHDCWRTEGGEDINPTHFRPLPDNRLADVCEVLLDALGYCYGEGSPSIQHGVDNAFTRAEAIAKGDKDV